MNDDRVREVVNDLFQHLEALETQCAALVQFLKEKAVGTDEEFARCMQGASEASSIKWHAARLRMEHLFSSIPEPAEKSSRSQTEQAETKPHDQPKKRSGNTAEERRTEAKTNGSPGKEKSEQSQQQKASETDSAASGDKERPAQPSGC